MDLYQQMFLYFLQHAPEQVCASSVSFTVIEAEEPSLEKPLCVMDFSFYNSSVISVLLNEKDANQSYIAQVPLDGIMVQAVPLESTSMINCKLSEICQPVNIKLSQGDSSNQELYYRKIDKLRCHNLAVSQRKLACVASARRIRIYETDVIEDEDDDVEEPEKSMLAEPADESAVLEDASF